jgi:hypothetical protein
MDSSFIGRKSYRTEGKNYAAFAKRKFPLVHLFPLQPADFTCLLRLDLMVLILSPFSEPLLGPLVGGGQGKLRRDLIKDARPPNQRQFPFYVALAVYS